MGYVREQLVHTVAVMVKRATLEVDKSKLFDSVFTTVSQLLAMDSKMVRTCTCTTEVLGTTFLFLYLVT